MREPDEAPEQDDSSAGIDSAAKDLIQAIQAQDVKAVAQALQAAYDICESGESEDSESDIEPHSYDSQKED